MTNFKVVWHKIKNRKAKQIKLNISNFYCEDKKAQYRNEVKNNMEKIEQQTTAQEKWNAICTVCTEAGEKVLGQMKKVVDEKDKTAQEISKEIHKVSKEIDATSGEEAKKKKEEKRKTESKAEKKIERD